MAFAMSLQPFFPLESVLTRSDGWPPSLKYCFVTSMLLGESTGLFGLVAVESQSKLPFEFAEDDPLPLPKSSLTPKF